MAALSNNKRLAKNTALLYVRMFFVLLLGLYTSRVVLNALGVSDYGVYNVVAGFVAMFGFLNATLSASMQRFYNFLLGKEGSSGVKKVYSIGVRIHLVVAILLFVILETIGIWYVNSVMSVPEGRLFAVNITYQTVVASLVLIVIQIPFVGLVLAYEKMSYYALVTVIDAVFKLLIALAIHYTSSDHLIVYSILMFGISVLNILMYVVYVKKKLLQNLRVGLFDRSVAKEILSFSGWNLIGTFAFLTKDQGLNLLLNYFFGTIVNAARGIAFQIKSCIGNFTHSITTSFRPQIVDAYANNNYKRVNELFFLESKVCFALILFLIIPIIAEVDFVLHIWLGDIVPDNTKIFTILVLIDGLVCSINPAINHVVHSVGDIKWYQIANTCVNITLVPFAWIVLLIRKEAVSIFVVSIVFSCMNQIVCLWQANKLFPFGLKRYSFDVIIPCVITATITFLPYFIIVHVVQQSFCRFCLVCFTDLLITSSVIFAIVLNRKEREYVIGIIKSLKKK